MLKFQVQIPSSIINNLLEEHVILVFEKKDVELDVLDIVECHRIGDSERVIVVLLKNRRDCKKILEKTNKQTQEC